MATEAVINKQATGLYNFYLKIYTEKYGHGPNSNRYRAKWGLRDMLEEYSYDVCKDVIEYFFRTEKPGHPIDFFLSNYDRLYRFMMERKEDERKREELRKQTEKNVREWESKNDR
jgi:hypothetical protein